MKGVRILAVAVALTLIFGVTAGAQSSASGRLAYVNLNRVFDEYSKTKDYDATLAKKSDEYQQARDEKIKKIQEAQGKLSALKESEKEKLQAQIEKDKSDLLELDRQKQTDLKKERDDKVREILMEIEKGVKDFAQQEKYSFIFNDKFLIYGDDSLEVTNQIIKLLNDKYPAAKK